MKYSENGIGGIIHISIRYAIMKTDEPPSIGG
jgi:hypothetical protein